MNMETIDVGKPPQFSKKKSFKINFHKLRDVQDGTSESEDAAFNYQGKRWTLRIRVTRDKRILKIKATLKLDAGSMKEEKLNLRYSIHCENSIPRPKLKIKDKTTGSLGRGRKSPTKTRVDNMSSTIKLFTKTDLSSASWELFSKTPKGDMLTLTVELEVGATMHENPWTPPSTLQPSMLVMLQGEKHADIKFHVSTVDDRRIFRAHSQILLTRSSPHMQEIIELAKQKSKHKKRRFDQDNTGFNRVAIQLPNVDPDHFQSILRYIYAEDVSVLETETDLKKLLATANQFGCWELKIHIEAKLIRDSLDFGSSIDLLLFADAQDCFMLEEAAIYKIVSNSVDLITHPDFPDLHGSPDLIQEVQRRIKNGGSYCDDDAGVTDMYSEMPISELYRELEKMGVQIESDESRTMLLKQLRSIL